ncbi:hypothetical protein L6258_01435, partial [Candidatus Parcubacteria bacterium]|nr:hypothetical protein [Candidatus Parcubacteria bacterium]
TCRRGEVYLGSPPVCEPGEVAEGWTRDCYVPPGKVGAKCSCCCWGAPQPCRTYCAEEHRSKWGLETCVEEAEWCGCPDGTWGYEIWEGSKWDIDLNGKPFCSIIRRAWVCESRPCRTYCAEEHRSKWGLNICVKKAGWCGCLDGRRGELFSWCDQYSIDLQGRPYCSVIKRGWFCSQEDSGSN